MTTEIEMTEAESDAERAEIRAMNAVRAKLEGEIKVINRRMKACDEGRIEARKSGNKRDERAYIRIYGELYAELRDAGERLEAL